MFSEMDGSDGGGARPPAATTSPPPTSDDVEAAERLIMLWDCAAASDDSPAARMLFDGPDRADALRYLHAVDEIHDEMHRSLRDPSGAGSPRRVAAAGAIQAAMARLEDEFRHILLTRANAVEIESLASDLSFASLSSADFPISGAGSGEDSCSHGEYKEEEAADEEAENAATGDGSSHGGGGGGISRTTTGASSHSYRSASSIREIDLVPVEAVEDLRGIAERMVAAGYGRECAQVYGSARKAAVDRSLRQLGVEKLSIGDVQRLEWEVLEAKIRRWIRAARACVRVVFASERRLCDQVFEGLPLPGDDAPFVETVKGAAIQLLGFAEAISIGRRSPEKLFKILDLHDALVDLLPDVAEVFLRHRPADPIHTQAAEIVSRLAEAARGIFSEFESAVLRDPSKIPVPGGTVHPLTRYVMNYICLISDYKPTLSQLIVSHPTPPPPPAGSPRFAVGAGGDDDAATPPPEAADLPEPEDQSPLAAHLVWIVVILQSNLESKARLYKDTALARLFLMNNVHYIVHKVKGYPELRGMVGDDYLKRLTGKFRQSATGYQRSAWGRVLHCLKEEGLHVSGGFSSGISKSTLRERFRAFNAAFDEAHRMQALWHVPDPQLREELRISISELLLPAYRGFLGRFRHHIETGRHPEMYIKYSVEDLEMALSDFFEGCPPSLHNRRRSH